MQSEYLLIGEITRPQGVRGEMRVRPYTDDPMRFEDLDEVYVKRGDKYEARGITFVRLNSDDVVIIRMDGVGDANAVEALRGEKLYVQVCYLLASDETVNREFGAYDSIRDNFPKYVVSLDEFDMSRNGIKHRNIRDFLTQSEWN